MMTNNPSVFTQENDMGHTITGHQPHSVTAESRSTILVAFNDSGGHASGSFPIGR
jgi:hypothetical protein